MPRSKKILVIDDERDIRMELRDTLTGYEVIDAADGEEGIALAHSERPDLIILDLMLPDIYGVEVCRRLKTDPRTKGIPVLMLTAKDDEVRGFEAGRADEFMMKPYERSRFLVRVRRLLVRGLPYKPEVRECMLRIVLEDKKQIIISATGALSVDRRSEQDENLEIARLVQKANTFPYPGLRQHVLDVGRDLYEKFFGKHSNVLSTYREALGAVSGPEKLHLRFASTREFLGVHVEAFYDPLEERILSLYHPLSRSITGTAKKRPVLSASFLNDLHENGEKLKILLIASNTASYDLPLIPCVDEEVESLGRSLGGMFEGKLQVQVEVMPTERASYEAVRRVLRGCQYHIVHYAGHALYDEGAPADSSLIFWEDAAKRDDVRKVSIAELESWLRNTSVNFFYLSCCSGTETSGQAKQFLNSSFRGIADCLVHAGVPSVLGFRWPVSDRGARLVAQTFYESLAETGHLDLALLEARNQAHIKLPAESAWLSPVLILQPD